MSTIQLTNHITKHIQCSLITSKLTYQWQMLTPGGCLVPI